MQNDHSFLTKSLNITYNTTSVRLADLELGIGRALAAVYWYGECQNGAVVVLPRLTRR